jgi:hypothetical protein
MNKLIETQLRAKSLRKSARTLKKFLVFIGSNQYIGHDISDEGVSFSFKSHDYATLLKHQKANISIHFLTDDRQVVQYNATIKVANLRAMSIDQMLYGCQILDTSLPDAHRMLVTLMPPDYPSLEALHQQETSYSYPIEPQLSRPQSRSLAENKQQRNEILRESAGLIQLMRRQSVNESLSCDDFRELVLTITNQLVDNDWFKKIETC